MLSVANLGVYQEGPVADGCATGSDFICGPKGGVESCRPCTARQLEVFHALQRQANNLVHALGLNTNLAVVSGADACAGGGYILSVDGRIGPCTRRTVSALRVRASEVVSPPPFYVAGAWVNSNANVAKYAEELLTYFDTVAAQVNAPKDVPSPAMQPISMGPSEGEPGPVLLPPIVTSPSEAQTFPIETIPASLPPSEPPIITVVPPPPEKKKSGAGIVIGLAVLTTIGLVGTGVYFMRAKR